MPDAGNRRVLLDENVDRLIEPLFDAELAVVRVDVQGWKGMKNGELLRMAEREFDVFVTMDRSLPHQQKIENYDLAVVVIRSISNSFVHVRPLMDGINGAVKSAKPGTVVEVAR